ncbi:hypothetical protein MMC12_005704 [Toensbergia leucococca]|nr:hypothetical protein [Toensbergia leucococca]
MTPHPFNITNARSHFPALNQPQIFLDNAGGSQTLNTVITDITNYLHQSNVQLGASYKVAQQSTSKYADGYKAAAAFMNAREDEIGMSLSCSNRDPEPHPHKFSPADHFTHPTTSVIGPSTTQLFTNLAQALRFPPGSEIILSSLDHEANISPWLRLAKSQDLTVKWWTPPPTNAHSLTLTRENLRPLLSKKTQLVACTHTSNVLGTIHDIRAIASEVHKIPGAMLCVDGVAFAPHREVDVKALGVDFYAFSWYKVYGPHISILYASQSAQTQLQSLGHYFHVPANDLSTKLNLAASSYELVASIPSILTYFGPDRKESWKAILTHEESLQSILLDYLNSKENVIVYGEESSDARSRVPVVSFSVLDVSSREIVEKVEACSDFGIRWGHFYSKRMVDEVLGLGPAGVVRVSMVHYNTEDEIQRLVEILNSVIP